MPLTLPSGLVPQPIILDPIEALGGPRVTDFRYDLFDADENFIGTLDSVKPGGSVETHTYSAVKGSGRITVTDLGQPIDWLNVRIRPVAELLGLADVSCGMYLCSAPVEKWSATGREWDVELLDKLSILDRDIPTDTDGYPVLYTAQAGANVIELVKALIVGAGETTPAIGISSKTLPVALVWDMGTTRLKIINDLLAVINYSSLWCDGEGQYQATPYVDPADRAPVYSSIAPFSKGDDSLMSPNWERDRDIYAVPNRYVAISQGDGTSEALISVAENMDPASPFSWQNRSERWVTDVVTGVEVSSQDDLDAYAIRGLVNATSVTSGFKVSHIFLPDVQINRTIRFTNPDAGLDMLTTIIITTIVFDPVALCSSELREVAL